MAVRGGHLDAADHGAWLLTADLGGTRMRVATFDGSGALVARTATETPADDAGSLLRALDSARKAAATPPAGVVVGVPGPVSYLDGVPLRLPNLPGWEGRISAQGLANGLGLPVVLANDADLAALGEHRYGAGVGTTDMAYLTSSTGVGAGIILNGRLLHGRRSLAEIGWTTINLDGPEGERRVEELGSGTALERRSGLEGSELEERARAGDTEALAVFERVARALAVGVMNLVFCFMPARVVIGGGVSQSEELVLDPVRRYLEREGPTMAIVPEVVLASGGDDVGLLGGLALWHDLAGPPSAGAPPLRPARPRG